MLQLENIEKSYDKQEQQELGFLQYIGLVTTYHCQTACPHCIVEAGPKRKEFVSQNNVKSWLKQIAKYKNGKILAVALTGGEPFSDLNHLRNISLLSESLGLFVTVVTNSYWATSEIVALKTLERLSSIRMLTLSTDRFHQRAIPLEFVRNAFNASKKLNKPCSIALCIGSSIDSETQVIIDFLDEFVPKSVINMARIFPVGRAQRLNHILQYSTSPTPPKAACCMAHSPVIFPDGKVVACFGPIIGLSKDHPLILGNLNDEPLATILDRAEKNYILHAIRVWGPYKLIEFILEAGLGEYLPQKYVTDSICCTCYELMNSPELVTFFNELNGNDEFSETVSYGRLYYLNEANMIEYLVK